MYDWKLECQIMSLFTAGEEQSLTRKVHESALADSPRGALGTKFSRTEGPVLSSLMQQSSTDTLRVSNKDTRKADSGSCSILWRAKWLFFPDSFKTQILQIVVNRVIKSHHQIIIYGSGNDFFLFPIDIFPLKRGQALLFKTNTPSVAASVVL